MHSLDSLLQCREDTFSLLDACSTQSPNEALSGSCERRSNRTYGHSSLTLSRLNNSDKGAVSHSIFHRALWEFLAQVSDLADDEALEKLQRSVFEEYVFFELISWRILDASWRMPRVIRRNSAYERWVARGPGNSWVEE